jgi:long-chain acyl-CoA synthetase
MMASGAAPLPAHIMDFLKVAFCCDVFQGYGMTENAAAGVVTPVGYLDGAGKVGEPVPSCEIKLEDVPEMNYVHTDKPYPRGEVCIRGHNVFSGYHNLPDKTKEALDADGWLHTGDIGQILPDGALQIIDRKKNIFKLAQGEYVAAEELEGHFKRSKYVGQIWVYGNSFNVTLIAVIVPNPETILPWCRENGIEGDFAEAVMTPQVNALFMDEIKRIGKEAKLAGFKVPKDVIIESEINELQQGFSTENDCLTPTFKLRRPQLLKRYQEQIDAIYEKRGGN